MIKGVIQKEDITLVNIYAFNIGISNYIKQIFMNIKGDINSNRVIGGDFNTHWHQWIEKSIRTQQLKWYIIQMDFIDSFRTFLAKAVENILFKCTRNIF